MPPRLFGADRLPKPFVFNPTIGIELKRAFSSTGDILQMNPLPLPDTDQTSEYLPPALVTLCTLYIHEHGATVGCENERLEVISYGRELLSVPIAKIEQINLYGNSHLTISAIKNCLKRKIPIFIFSGPARLLGSIESHQNENLELRQLQYERSQDLAFRLDVARRIVLAKVNNCKGFLQRKARGGPSDFDPLVDRLTEILICLSDASTFDEVMGYEGAAAATYFRGLSKSLPEPFRFAKRSKRPPTDPANALLSFGYTILFQNIFALTRARGLSAYVSFLHSASQGHPALVSDFVEEFRVPIVDTMVAGAFNKKVFTSDDFYFEESEAGDDLEETDHLESPDNIAEPIVLPKACRLTDNARRRYIQEFEKRMNTTVTHRGANIQTTWRGCIDLQIGHLIQVLRHEAGHYRPVEFR